MRRLDKTDILATNYKEWLDALAEDINHPTYKSSKGKFYYDIIANLIWIQKGLCAYTEFCMQDYDKCGVEHWTNGFFKQFEFAGELDTKINNWLSSFITNKLPNGNEITVVQCMKHETVVPDVIEQDAFYLAVLNDPNKIWKSEELLEFIYNKPVVFHPGDSAIYSNTNTTLVIMVIEAATHRKHSDLLKQYVLDPLHLINTYYQPHNVLSITVAQGYCDLHNNNTSVNVSNVVTGSGNGNGGIYSKFLISALS